MSTLKVNNITDLGNEYPGSLAYPGQILQVVNSIKTDVFSTTSLSDVDVPSLSASITPSSTSSKILIMLSVSAGGTTVKRFNIKRNSTFITQADSGGSSSATINSTMTDTNGRYTLSAIVLDQPGTTSEILYQITAYTTTGTLIINSGASDNRGISTITLMEVAG